MIKIKTKQEYLHVPGISEYFLNKIMEKTDNLDLTEIMNFYSSKDNFKRVKSQATDWEKILQNISDKGLTSKICKEPLHTNLKNTQFY